MKILVEDGKVKQSKLSQIDFVSSALELGEGIVYF